MSKFKREKNPLPKDFNKDLRNHKPVKIVSRSKAVPTSAKKHRHLRRIRTGLAKKTKRLVFKASNRYSPSKESIDHGSEIKRG